MGRGGLGYQRGVGVLICVVAQGRHVGEVAHHVRGGIRQARSPADVRGRATRVVEGQGGIAGWAAKHHGAVERALNARCGPVGVAQGG